MQAQNPSHEAIERSVVHINPSLLAPYLQGFPATDFASWSRTTMDGITIIAILVCVAALVIWKARSDTQAVDRFKVAMDSVHEDLAAFSYVTPQRDKAIALDPQSMTLHIFAPAGEAMRCVCIPGTAILSAEVFEDGASVVSRSSMRTAGGALLGGALFGKAGAVVGGLSGRQRSEGMCNVIELRITVDDIKSPIHAARFLSHEVKRSSEVYAQASTAAREWHGRLVVLMKRAEAEPQAVPAAVTTRMLTAAPKLPPPPTPVKLTKAAERQQKLEKAREIGAARRAAAPGEHRLDAD